VIGITSQINVEELLEKRVQSRFSGSKIFLNFINSKVNSFKDRIEKFRSLLSLTEDSQLSTSFITKWNNKVNELCDDEVVIDVLKQQFYITRNEKIFTNFVVCILVSSIIF